MSEEILQNKSIYAKYYECPCCWLSNFKYVAGNPVRIPELSRSRLFLICLICQIRGPAADELTNSAILLPNADSFFSLKLSRQYSTLIGEKNAMLPNKKTWIFIGNNKLSIKVLFILQFPYSVGISHRFSVGDLGLGSSRPLGHLHEIVQVPVADRNNLNCGVQVCPQWSVMLPVCN